MKQPFRFVIASLLALGLFACQSPLRPTEGTMGSFHLLAASPQEVMKPGKTTLPTLPSFHYTVELTGSTTLSFTKLTDLSESFEAPVGNYTLRVTLLNTAGKVIGLSGPIAITVQADATKNVFPVTVAPQSSGNGKVSITYTWPAADDGSVLVDQAFLAMASLERGELVDLDSLATFDLEGQKASVKGTLASGTYLLTLRLGKYVDGAFYFHPAVTEIVRIYDNLESSRSYVLTSSDLQSKPESPVSVLASFDGTSFHVSWAANPGTQSGFHVYRNGTLWSTEDPGTTTFDAQGVPESPNEVIEVTAFNAFGESEPVASTIEMDQMVPITSYSLKVGTSLTSGPASTSLALSWTAPEEQSVSLYRATSVEGPYTLVTTTTKSSFTDSEAHGLTVGTTYYYALATQGGSLWGLPTTPLLSSTGAAPPFDHVDPVPGVVSGTTLAWDAASSTGVPVVGVPYLVPDTSQLPLLTLPDFWRGPELPASAFLAGGYTYWVWGATFENDSRMTIAAFDSAGKLKKTYQTNARYVTSLAVSGTDLLIERQGGTTVVPWNTLAWFQPATYAVTVNFQVPTAPVIQLDAGGAANGIEIDGTENSPQSLSIDPRLGSLPGYSLVGWTIDGASAYPDTTPFDIDSNGVFTVYGDLLDPGTHEIMVLVTDGAHVYSANFNIVIVRLGVPQ